MSDDRSFNKKRIAKNTALLYVRMFLTMIVGLYTSRVVLNTLGVSDYGIYNVVGGIVTMLSFLNGAMTASSQRFISYGLGKGDKVELNRVFSTSINIHLLIALIIFAFAETVGLWLVNTHLNIEASRMTAANWVYQFSILTFMLTVLSVPYNSCIVAHEHMNAFAYISILEVTLKLVIVYCLLLFEYDKLILYGILVFAVALIIRICYGTYCKRHFEECTYHFILDKELFKKMFSFAGWSIIGNIGFTLRNPASNIILNIFFGTTVNAARGIAMQVSGIVTTFSGNFSIAVTPQITKQYAAGNIETSSKLVYAGARYSFYLLSLITIPFLINIDYVLQLWLGIVPEYTSIFLALALLADLLYALSESVTVALQATGRIKVFQIGICILMLSELPVTYILLKLGMPPYVAMYPTLATNTIAIFFRFYLLKKMIPFYDFKYYITHVFVRSILLFTLCYFICSYIHKFFHNNFITVVVTSAISVCIISLVIYTFGMTKLERKMLINKFINLVNRIIN